MELGINCQWLGQEAVNAENHLLCRLEIRAGEHILTKNIIEDSQSAENFAIVSAWALAAWLAGNWWRILYETGHKWGQYGRPITEWERSHYLPAADYGYQWPRIHLVSDDKFVHLNMTPDPADDTRLARYIGDFGHILVPREKFAQGAANFLREAKARLAQRFPDDDLCGLVAQLFGEIGDESFAEYRKIEAMLGYDPDEAQEEVINRGRAIIRKYGQDFFNAMASSININFITDARPAESLENIYNAAEEVGRHGIRGKFVLGDDVAFAKPDLVEPWAYGRALARALRNKIGLDQERRLDTSTLREWFELGEYEMKNGLPCGESGICHREGDALRFRFAGESSWQYSRNRRFFLCRLTGACLDGAPSWLAIGPGATWDQKMQRAFAAELIAPIEAICGMLPPHEPERSDAEKIADHFDASHYTIAYSLANNHVITREKAEALVE